MLFSLKNVNTPFSVKMCATFQCTMLSNATYRRMIRLNFNEIKCLNLFAPYCMKSIQIAFFMKNNLVNNFFNETISKSNEIILSDSKFINAGNAFFNYVFIEISLIISKFYWIYFRVSQ